MSLIRAQASATRYQHVVLDIGGTWFRSALRQRDGGLAGLIRHPAVNYLNNPGLSQAQLRQRLIDYILRQIRRLAPHEKNEPLRVSISMGAAVNGYTGAILDAGPLWGPNGQPLDLKSVLTQARSDAIWSVANDVTALAAYFASGPTYENFAKISVLTVSTGIACRTVEVGTGRVPLHPARGIQGEIGHIPINFRAHGHALDLRCDCGGLAHLNAYCSGRGIPQVMRHLAPIMQQPEWQDAAMQRDPAHWVTALQRGLAGQEAAADLLLDSVVEPVARSIISMLAVDPEIARVVITGGVPHSLGQAYEAALLRNLESIGLYMISDGDPAYFYTLVDFASSDIDAGLHGAALVAESLEGTSHTDPPRTSNLLSHRHRRMTERPKSQYDVTITDPGGAGAALARVLTEMGSAKQPVLLADETVFNIHGPAVVSQLEVVGFAPVLRTVVAGEAAKSWVTLETILETLGSIDVSRRQHPIIALGGGAVLDAVGLAAGLFRRGVPYVRVPTSLVGLIDAGVGAKVAINGFGRKNRIGMFYPPKSVVLDSAFLQTLPARFLISGVAEMIKIAVVSDRDLFDQLERNSAYLIDPAFYRSERGLELLARAANAMLSELQGNLWEDNLERAVDFGHTFSQALETTNQNVVTHGDAVAVDMALSLEIGRDRGITGSRDADRILRLITRVGLPAYSDRVTAEELLRALEEATSHRGGEQRLPLVRALGGRPTFVSDIDRGELTSSWSRLQLRVGRL